MAEKKYLRYVIEQHDTVELVATKFLGSPSRWGEIAIANKLRYPFISDDPLDQFGEPLLTTVLTAPFSGGVRLQVRDFDPTAFQAGRYVLMQGSGGIASRSFYDVGVIFGYGTPQNKGQWWSPEMQSEYTASILNILPQTTLIELTGQPTHSYAAGTRVSIFDDPSLAKSQVLGTGSTLLIPSEETNADIISLQEGQFTSLLGTDIGIDTNGFLLLDSRDLSLVTGTANVSQSLRIRATTETGELLTHPQYGDRLLAYVGSTSDSLLALAYASLAECFLADPRVGKISSLSVSQDGDTLIANVSVALRDRNDLITLNNLILTEGK